MCFWHSWHTRKMKSFLVYGIYLFFNQILSDQWHVIPDRHVVLCFLVSHSLEFLRYVHYSHLLEVLWGQKALILSCVSYLFWLWDVFSECYGIVWSFVNLSRGEMPSLAPSSLKCLFFRRFQCKNIDRPNGMPSTTFICTVLLND